MSKLQGIPEGKKAKSVVKKSRAVKGEVVRMGRPTDFSDELAASICAMLAEGKSMRAVCREENMPSLSQVFVWLNKYPNFAEQYARAKEESAEALAEDIHQISRDTLNGVYDPASARVATDNLKWIASKLKPKKYGDKVDLTTNGKDMPTPILGMLNITDENKPNG